MLRKHISLRRKKEFVCGYRPARIGGRKSPVSNLCQSRPHSVLSQNECIAQCFLAMQLRMKPHHNLPDRLIFKERIDFPETQNKRRNLRDFRDRGKSVLQFHELEITRKALLTLLFLLDRDFRTTLRRGLAKTKDENRELIKTKTRHTPNPGELSSCDVADTVMDVSACVAANWWTCCWFCERADSTIARNCATTCAASVSTSDNWTESNV